MIDPRAQRRLDRQWCEFLPTATGETERRSFWRRHAGHRELLRAARANPEWAEALRIDEELDGALRTKGRLAREEKGAFVATLLRRLDATADGPRFAEHLETRLRTHSKFNPRRRWVRAVPAVAATAAGVGLLWAMRGHQERPIETVPTSAGIDATSGLMAPPPPPEEATADAAQIPFEAIAPPTTAPSKDAARPTVAPSEEAAGPTAVAPSDAAWSLRFDFEAEDPWKGPVTGVRVACPQRAGHCLEGEVPPPQGVRQHAGKVFQPALRYSDTVWISFDAWVGEGRGPLAVTLLSRHRRQWYARRFPVTTRHRWMHVVVRARDLSGVLDPQAPMQPGDPINILSIRAGRPGGSPFYVDNVVIADTGAAGAPPASTIDSIEPRNPEGAPR